MKRAATLALSAALTAAHPGAAWALDGHQDRRGALGGLGIGGGGGSTDTDNATVRDGAGLTLTARVGGGLSQDLTMDLSFMWFTRDRVGHGLLAVAGNAYVTDEVFVRLGTGLGRGTVTDGDGDEVASDFSLGALVGGGVEFFLNSNLAASLTVQGQYHFLSAVRYTGVHGVAALTWY